MIPAAFKDEPTGAQTSAYAECYKTFAKKHGYPYNQVKTISDFTKDADRYIECVGADVGYVDDGGTEPTFSYYLTPSEIAEINNFMNIKRKLRTIPQIIQLRQVNLLFIGLIFLIISYKAVYH